MERNNIGKVLTILWISVSLKLKISFSELCVSTYSWRHSLQSLMPYKIYRCIELTVHLLFAFYSVSQAFRGNFSSPLSLSWFLSWILLSLSVSLLQFFSIGFKSILRWTNYGISNEMGNFSRSWVYAGMSTFDHIFALLFPSSHLF